MGTVPSVALGVTAGVEFRNGFGRCCNVDDTSAGPAKDSDIRFVLVATINTERAGRDSSDVRLSDHRFDDSLRSLGVRLGASGPARYSRMGRVGDVTPFTVVCVGT